MNNEGSKLLARKIAITLMRSAIALLDRAGEAGAAAALQNAIDITQERQTPEQS